MKKAIVTGGNSGIGFAIAQILKDNSYHVTITGKNETALVNAAKALDCEYINGDLTEEKSIKKISEPFFNSGLDVLVNNAGIGKSIPFSDMNLIDFENHININLRSPIMLTHALLNPLRKNQGAVINISSAITYKAAQAFSLYAATKGGLESWTKNLALELAEDNVRVNAICPGAIDTPMFNKLGFPEEALPEVKKHVLTTVPLGKMGTPKDIAEVALTMINSSYVTGSIWRVDGGVGVQ